MMTNLFSMFDPLTSIMSLPLNWLSILIGLLIVPNYYWLIPSRWNIMWNMMLMTLNKEFKTIMGKKSQNGSTFIFISMFSMIMYSNFLGLFPYIFTCTSHMILTISISLPLWMSFILFGFFNNMKHMLAHMVPNSTPMILMPFMVCIETISNLIRPMTLAVRLAANMIAGHLLLTLMGNTGPLMTSISMVVMLVMAQCMLMILEIAVAFIQAYVFVVLSTLYSSEVI